MCGENTTTNQVMTLKKEGISISGQVFLVLTKEVCVYILLKIENNFLCINCNVRHFTILGTVEPVPEIPSKFNCDLINCISSVDIL